MKMESTHEDRKIQVLEKEVILPPGYTKHEDLVEKIKSESEATSDFPIGSSEVSNSIASEIKSKNKTLSFIQDHEEEDAKKFIEKHMGFEPPRMTGYMLCIKVYVRPDEISEFTDENGVKKSFYLPQSVTALDKFKSCTGLVIAMGPECYRGSRFEENIFEKSIRFLFGKWMKPSYKKPWCKVGDWVCFPRHEGTQVVYRGIPVHYVADNRLLGVIEDPTFVTRD